MKKSRWQRWLSAIVCLAMLISLFPTVSYAAEAGTEENYVSNQGVLNENAFVRLPMGAVEAEDWLLQQLYYQKEGLTGLLQDNYSIYGPNNAWRGGNGDYWEKGPYYLRGLMSLAWVLDDQELKDMAMEWINPILESQTSTGYFGPATHGDGTGNTWDWWPHMVVLQLLRDYYEATELEGNPDERVMDVLGGYFKFQQNYLNTNHVLDYWASARGADNIDVVLWYYNRVYDEANPEASDWLIDLAYTIYSYSYNWTDIYTDGTARQHVVNTTQGWKSPAVIWQLTGNERNRDGLWYALRNMGIDHGRIDNLPNADELARDNVPYHGTETCAVVEGMLSYEMSVAILGQGWIGDELEYLAYNSLPACYTNDFTSHVYYQTQNQVMATHGGHEHLQEHSDSIAYGVCSGYECCFPNMHMGWPKFVQSMWMATTDGGLAVIAYGPNSVTAKVADGAVAKFHQKTDYPFKDTIGLTYEGQTASFPLMLRVPGWCENPSFKVNGETVTAEIVDGFITIDREWTQGDVVEIVFPMEVRITNWYNDSVAVMYGTLDFSINVEEEWIVSTDDSAAGSAFYYPTNAEKPNDYETLAGSAWNYALVIDWDDIASSFQVTVDDEVGLQPFTQGYSPITIKATGQIVPDWKLKGNVVPEPPYSPIAEDTSLQEEIELIPYGAARLRITQIPWVGQTNEDLATVKTTEDNASVYEQDGKSVVEFDNVMVRTADNYVLTANYTGTGSVTVEINTVYTKTFACSGEPIVIDNMNTVTSGDFDFAYGQYNNIRFIGDGSVQVTDLTITPVNPFTTPVIEGGYLNRNLTTMTVETNISRAAGFWTLEYGTEPGKYTVTVENLFEENAVITGLSGDVDTYYVRASMLANGEKVYTEEFTVDGTREVVPAEFYDDFSDPEASASKWEVLGDANVVTFAEGELQVGRSSDIKLTTGDEDWTDYAIEATISSHSVNYNNFGVFFRATNVGTGADGYNGYYVGIEAASGKGVMVGYADGSWHQLAVAGEFAYNHNQDYKMTILVCGDTFKVYVDGEFIYELTDSRYTNGKVGIRSWNQPFNLDQFEVRPLTEEEAALFESTGGSDDTVEEFTFAPTAADWELLGNTDSMTVGEDGSVTVSANQNVKALTGDVSWTDYVIQADVALSDVETTVMAQYHNGGIIFRSTEATGDNADSYKGYYFGIGNYEEEVGGGYAVIGYGNYGWSELTRVRYDEAFELGQNYRLKVIVCGNKLAFYLDGELIASLTNDLFSQGRVGTRGWSKSYSVSNLTVRSLNESDIAALSEPLDTEECLRVYNAVQMFFPAMASDGAYTIAYGTEPGKYTTYVTNLVGMTWTENVKLTISLPDNDTTYYVRVFATNDPSISTKEVELKGLNDGGTIGYTVTEADKAKLNALLAEAQALTADGWTEDSWNRLERAVAFANVVLADEDVNMSEISLATSNLKIGLYNLEDASALAVQEVIDAINMIGRVTADSGEKLDQIRAAYEALTEEQKAQVTNYGLLVAAECEYQVFVAIEIAAEAQIIADAAKADAEAAQAAADAAAAIEAEDKSAAEAAAKAAADAWEKYEATQAAADAVQETVEAVKAAAKTADPEAVAEAVALVEAAVAETQTAADSVKTARAIAEACLRAQELRAAAEKAQREAEEAARKAEEEREAAERAAEEARKAAEAAAAELELAIAKYNAIDELTTYAEGYTGVEAALKEGIGLINAVGTPEEVEAALEAAKALIDAAGEAVAVCPSGKFTDVGEGWYHDAVDFMVAKGYMEGLSATVFGVNENVTRAQLVTVLYRVAGEPSVDDLDNPFTDVAAGKWYTDAVIWAASEGIVKGLSETAFAPDMDISREQIVTILYRYAGAEPVAEDSLASFTDAESVSGWAKDAMNWAVAQGLVKGVTNTTLQPTATATRAQICTILMRYLAE